jgi:DNA-binding MurR/RpiR family transcriptional regulator
MEEAGAAHTGADEEEIAPNEPDFAAVKQRLETAYPGLSPQLRHAARYVLDRPDDVALHSMRHLASIAGVHPSTMVRLARAMDFPGYVDFREPFRQRLRGAGAGYLDRVRHLQARGRDTDAAALIGDMLTADLGNLGQSFADIGVDRLSECVAEMSAARRVYVVGLRSCYPVAFFFHYGWSMFEDKTVLLDGRGGTFADELRAIGEGDAMLAISFTPYTREVVRAVSHAKDRGARIIAITDSAVSPLARRADWPLIVSTDSPSFFHSVVPALAVVQSMIALLAARGGTAALDSLAASVDQLDSFRAYWDAPHGGSHRP